MTFLRFVSGRGDLDAVCVHIVEGIFIIRRRRYASKFLRSFIPSRYDMHNRVKIQLYQMGGSKDRSSNTDTHHIHNEKQRGIAVFEGKSIKNL
jgi:hypothetical protein